MDTQDIRMSDHHRDVVNRCVAVCQADPRVVAAFLGGSYAKGTADAYSDLDLYVIVADADYETFFAGRQAFVTQLGEPVFLENYDVLRLVLFMFADGTEGELGIGRESDFLNIHGGPYRVLLDKKGVLAGVVFPGYEPPHADQIETLRRLIIWFWRDLSHFITALARGQWWWARGQLDELRRQCIDLARLRHDFTAPAAGYEKLDNMLPPEQLSPLQDTFCPMDRDSMLKAIRVIIAYYQEVVPPLVAQHGIPYPHELERVMLGRLEH